MIDPVLGKMLLTTLTYGAWGSEVDGVMRIMH